MARLTGGFRVVTNAPTMDGDAAAWPLTHISYSRRVGDNTERSLMARFPRGLRVVTNAPTMDGKTHRVPAATLLP